MYPLLSAPITGLVESIPDLEIFRGVEKVWPLFEEEVKKISLLLLYDASHTTNTAWPLSAIFGDAESDSVPDRFRGFTKTLLFWEDVKKILPTSSQTK